jgi:hypothetical protein
MNKLSIACVFALVLGCTTKSSSESVKPGPAPASAPSKTPAPAPTPLPAAKETPAPKEAPAAEATHAPGTPLVFTAPADWTVETPSSKMRVAQYKLAKVEGDSEDAELVVYHFGATGGGGVEQNIERWCGQFEQEGGKKSSEVAVRSKRMVAGLTVDDVSLSGKYVAETAPGSGEHLNKPGFAMLASIIQGGDGDYYAKLIGPAKTVEHHAAAYRTFISSIK